MGRQRDAQPAGAAARPTREIDALLLIGAYRDNEVGPAHPLTRALAELEEAGVAIRRVPLEPLALPDLASLVRDTLHCDLEAAEPLARLVSQKTGGNPFFVGQFLKALREAELLRFDYERERWTFEMDAIARAGMTDNVIDLMTRKIQRLSAGDPARPDTGVVHRQSVRPAHPRHRERAIPRGRRGGSGRGDRGGPGPDDRPGPPRTPSCTIGSSSRPTR